jgi:general secretion pathway protein G
MRHRNEKGFTLIELLIVVAIIGIIAAIAIPNLLNAIQRGKQKRTMADIRSCGTAVESYSIDNGFPPNEASSTNLRASLDEYVEPTFIRTLPSVDGWKMNYQWVKLTSGDDSYTIISYGKDRSTSGCANNTETKTFAADICFSDGQFVQYPAGTQN